MANSVDAQIIKNACLTTISAMFGGNPLVSPSQEPEHETIDIEIVEDRIKLSALGMFEGAAYVGAVGFFANQGDSDRNKNPKGIVTLYVEDQGASKFYKISGINFADDEDDRSMNTACGQLAAKIAEEINKSVSSGYILGKPVTGRNQIVGGFEPVSGIKKCERIKCFFLRHKSLVVDIILTSR